MLVFCFVSGHCSCYFQASRPAEAMKRRARACLLRQFLFECACPLCVQQKTEAGGIEETSDDELDL